MWYFHKKLIYKETKMKSSDCYEATPCFCILRDGQHLASYVGKPMVNKPPISHCWINTHSREGQREMFLSIDPFFHASIDDSGSTDIQRVWVCQLCTIVLTEDQKPIYFSLFFDQSANISAIFGFKSNQLSLTDKKAIRLAVIFHSNVHTFMFLLTNPEFN